MQWIESLLETVVGYVWNIPMVVLLIGTGILLSLLLGTRRGPVQLRGFLHAIDIVRGRYDDPDEPGQISHFQALTTALSATVGLGNIAGVAVAMHFGGPGATFWMIVAGFVGMATKYAECTLAVKYRHIDENGVVHGGPMHYIERGLGKRWRPLAVFFALAAIAASFGAANMFQTNQVAIILESAYAVPRAVTGVTIAILTGMVILGGITRIGKVTAFLVPFMGGIYMLGAALVIAMNLPLVPELLLRIVTEAFTGTAAAGGFAGIAISQVLIQGVRRAAFSNEAGLGSAPIAHAAAATDEPVREGVVALLEPFIDTVIICTMTALVILITGAWAVGPEVAKPGVELTAYAFNQVIPGFGTWFVPIAVAMFAYSTLISWSYYGERAVDYIFREKSKGAILAYKAVFCVLAFVGAMWTYGPVLNFSDIMLGLMVVPNLLAVWMLFPQLRHDTINYFARLDRGEFDQDARLAAEHRAAHGKKIV